MSNTQVSSERHMIGERKTNNYQEVSLDSVRFIKTKQNYIHYP